MICFLIILGTNFIIFGAYSLYSVLSLLYSVLSSSYSVLSSLYSVLSLSCSVLKTPYSVLKSSYAVDTCFYYPTSLCRVQITPKTSTNITRYLYSRGPVRQVFSQRASDEFDSSYE